MQAFHDDQLQKDKYVSIMESAYRNGKIVSGEYWCADEQQGCLVGTITHNSDHGQFARDMNLPLWFPYLLESVFEGLPEGDRQKFAVNVIKAIPKGFSNWQSLYHKICLFNLQKICKNTDHPLVKQPIADIIVLHKKEEQDNEKWSVAESAAWSARSVRSAAWSAAETVWSVRSVAESVRSAAWSVRSAVWSAWSAAWSAAYQKIADEIIRLLGEKY